MKKLIGRVCTVAVFAVFLFLLLVAITRGQSQFVATGGPYALEKTVVAGGGSDKENTPVKENGTTGQALAGKTSTGGQYSIYSGFWTPESFAPTAAGVTISGQIVTARGLGIRNVVVTLTYPSGAIRSVLSSSFGHYRFDEVPAGDTYILSVSAKGYTFTEPTRVLHVVDEVMNADFVAN